MFPANYLGHPIPLNQLFLKAVQENKVSDGTFSIRNCRLNQQDLQFLLDAMKYNTKLDGDIDVLIRVNGIKDSDPEYGVLKTLQKRNMQIKQAKGPMEPLNIYNRYAAELGIPPIHRPIPSLLSLCKFYFVDTKPSAPLSMPPLSLPAILIEDIFNARILHLLAKYKKELIFIQGSVKYDDGLSFQRFLQLVPKLDDKNISKAILKQDLRNLTIEEIEVFLQEIAKNHYIQSPITILNVLVILIQNKNFWPQGPLHKQLADVFRHCDNVRLRNCRSAVPGATSDVAMSFEATEDPITSNILTPYWVIMDELQQRRLSAPEEDYEEYESDSSADEAASSAHSAAPSASAHELDASRVSGAAVTVEDDLPHHEVADTKTHLGGAPKI